MNIKDKLKFYKRYINKMKREVQKEWEKIFADYISDKGLLEYEKISYI